MVDQTRVFLWNIPDSFKIIMYVGLLVAIAIMKYGFLKKFQFVSGGNLKNLFKENGGLLRQPLQWRKFFGTLLFTGKVDRSPEVKKFHHLIFYGFMVLLIATEFAAIHLDTPFDIYKGIPYIIISFLADIAGVLILVGIYYAYKRRYVVKPDYLKSTHPNQEKNMYAMLIALVVLGFIIEGMRIYGTGALRAEIFVSPVGSLFAGIISILPFSHDQLAFGFRWLWMIHMLNTMVFIAALGHTKFSHIFMLPFASLITKPMDGAVLKPMDFENEDAETFGLGKLSELTQKQNLDLLSCVECGRCTQVCPANLADRPLDPKMIVTKARDLKFESAEDKDHDFWENNTYSASELDACTTCGACMEECPSNIEHVQIIMDLKRYKALTLGQIPAEAATAVNNIRVNGNPWGISQDERMNWANGLDVPVAEEGKEIDYLYYVGCAGSYDGSNQQVVKDTVGLLKKAGVNFAVMGKTEKCNGDPIRRFGDEYSFFEVAIENIANMNKYKFKKVVTHCPHCLHTIGKEYAKFDNGAFDTVHHTELLAELVKTGKLNPTKSIGQSLTFHDPCYLGRHHGEYNAPREILKSIPELELKEMERNKDKSLCCGMGGGNMWYELPEGHDPAENRINDIAETKTEKLATACSFCLINFHSAKSSNDKTENLDIQDVASILAKSIV